MIFSSIRWRIQAWHGALLVAVVTGFGFTAHRLASANRLRQIDEELQAHSAQLSVAVPPAGEGDPGRPGTGDRRRAKVAASPIKSSPAASTSPSSSPTEPLKCAR